MVILARRRSVKLKQRSFLGALGVGGRDPLIVKSALHFSLPPKKIKNIFVALLFRLRLYGSFARGE